MFSLHNGLGASVPNIWVVVELKVDVDVAASTTVWVVFDEPVKRPNAALYCQIVLVAVEFAWVMDMPVPTEELKLRLLQLQLPGGSYRSASGMRSGTRSPVGLIAPCIQASVGADIPGVTVPQSELG
jgi:hypothetical protein